MVCVFLGLDDAIQFFEGECVRGMLLICVFSLGNVAVWCSLWLPWWAEVGRV